MNSFKYIFLHKPAARLFVQVVARNRPILFALAGLLNLLLLVCLSPNLFAQKNDSSPHWTIKEYGIEQGLEYKNISSLVFDKNGTAWLGNEQGLQIFDGKKLYPASNYLKSYDEILQLPVDHILYDSSINCLFVFAYQRPHTLVYSIRLDKINTHSNALKKHRLLYGKIFDKPIYINHKIYCNPGDYPEILIFDQDNMIKFLKNYTLSSYHAFEAGNGQVYYDHKNQTKLYKAKIEGDSFLLIPEVNLSLKANNELFKSKGEFTSSKAAHYQNKALQKQLRMASYAQRFGLKEEYYKDAFYTEDAHGNYYIYGQNGLQKITRKVAFISGQKTPNETRNILYDKIKDVFYVGTSRGVYLIDRKSKGVTELDTGNEFKKYICCGQPIGDSLFAFFVNEDYTPTILINKNNNQYWRKEGRKKLRVWNIYKQNKLTYYCTDRGLYTGQYAKGEFSFQKIDLGLQDELFDMLSLSEEEYVLAGRNGLYRYHTIKKSCQLIMPGEFLCLEKLQDYIIVGSAKKGVLFFDHSMVLQKILDKHSGLKINTVFSMLTDQSLNALWIGTAQGLTLYHLPTGICKTYTIVDGLVNNEFNRASTYKFKSDSLYVMGGIMGLNYIQNKLPFFPPGKKVDIPIVWAIEAVYDNQKIEKKWLDICHSELVKLDSRVNRITLKIAQTNTEFLFATAYKLKNETNWKYKLAGEDIEILSPPSGTLCIELRSLWANGHESKTIEIPIKIEAEWYGKPWGIALISFGFILLLFPLFYLRDYYLKQKNEKLINKNKEKLFTIIAHDLRSPIKTYQGLSEIISYLIEKKDWESIKHVSQNIDNTGQKLDLMLENLLNWSLLEQKELKPIKQICNVNKISSALVELYKLIAARKNINIITIIENQVDFYSDENLLNLLLRNLLDNAVKNASEGSEITLKISVHNDLLTIEVENSFDPKMYPQVENFVKNIKLPHKFKGRGIGHKFILQSIQLLNGELKAQLTKDQKKINITINIPNLK